MLEPDDGKLSSPVLRGLAPSNGGRLLGALPGDGTCGQEGRTDLSSVGAASSGQPQCDPDETGWKVGGQLWWMWVFSTAQVTVYAIQLGADLNKRPGYTNRR